MHGSGYICSINGIKDGYDKIPACIELFKTKYKSIHEQCQKTLGIDVSKVEVSVERPPSIRKISSQKSIMTIQCTDIERELMPDLLGSSMFYDPGINVFFCYF
eukprot:Pgem_evm1s11244